MNNLNSHLFNIPLPYNSPHVIKIINKSQLPQPTLPPMTLANSKCGQCDTYFWEKSSDERFAQYKI